MVAEVDFTAEEVASTVGADSLAEVSMAGEDFTEEAGCAVEVGFAAGADSVAEGVSAAAARFVVDLAFAEERDFADAASGADFVATASAVVFVAVAFAVAGVGEAGVGTGDGA